LAQPLRRQAFFIVVILTLLVYVAIGYGARMTYNEHVRQMAAETGTMAATVVVYVNRNLETADAVADTASRHPSMRALNPTAAVEVLGPLATPGGLLHNALMADADGRILAWAGPVDPAVEGKLDQSWLKTVVTTGKSLVSPMLGGAGDDAHAIVLGYPIVLTAAKDIRRGTLSINELVAIAVLAAFRTFSQHSGGRTPRWDKTEHVFPKEAVQ